MREFFKGWRRKAGCVLLVMALALMGMWVRSLIVADAAALQIVNRQYYIDSLDGAVTWGSYEFPIVSLDLKSPIFQSVTASKTDQLFKLKRLTVIPSNIDRQWVFRYWQLVLPLTLLSAYLILWKPRAKK